MIADDPIFALIERHRGATRTFSAAVSNKDKVQRRIGLGAMRQNG
jgi:hypothetical protein